MIEQSFEKDKQGVLELESLIFSYFKISETKNYPKYN